MSVSVNGKSLIPFKQTVRDETTGFTGRVVGVTIWKTGRVQYCVQRPEMNRGLWFDRNKIVEVRDDGADSEDEDVYDT